MKDRVTECCRCTFPLVAMHLLTCSKPKLGVFCSKKALLKTQAPPLFMFILILAVPPPTLFMNSSLSNIYVEGIGVFFGLVGIEVDGFHWFRLVSFHVQGHLAFKRSSIVAGLSLEETFTQIYATSAWGKGSGAGSLPAHCLSWRLAV